MQKITQLKGLEAVRRRPGMFIGGTDQRALECCVFELIGNSIEEHLAGRGFLITVTIHDDGSLSVKDDGGGISVALDSSSQLPYVQRVLTTFYVPDADAKPYRALGTCGVGMKCVNAVSEWMTVNTVWEKREFQILFARGQITQPLRKLAETSAAAGTLVRFMPDPEIFGATTFNRKSLSDRLDHLAVLHPALAFVLVDERANVANRALVSLFQYPNGIADYLNASPPAKPRRIMEPVVLDGESDGVRVALGFQFVESENTTLHSFVNSTPTRRGGTHVQGFLKGVANTLNELAPKQRPFSSADMRPGLDAFVGVWLQDPRFGGAVKEELINPEIELLVYELVSSRLQAWAAKCGDSGKWLAEWLDENRGGKIHETS